MPITMTNQFDPNSAEDLKEAAKQLLSGTSSAGDEAQVTKAADAIKASLGASYTPVPMDRGGSVIQIEGVSFYSDWFGFTISVSHQALESVASAADFLAALAALAAAIIAASGGTLAVAAGVLAAALGVKWAQMKLFDRGNGINMKSPWIAVFTLWVESR